MRARVIKKEVQGDRTIVWVAKGSQDGVDTSWEGNLLVGDSDKNVANGACAIIRADKRVTVCALKLTVDQVSASSFVRLSATKR
jgi:hypothetical protein